MNRLIIAILSAMAVFSAYADNWCETLIKQLNSTSGIDKTIRTNRDPQSHKIVTAVYDYKFGSDKVFRMIRDNMRQHIDEADYFSETGEETSLMRFTIDGMRWDCKLQRTKQGNIFLVNASQSGQSQQQPQQPSTRQSKTSAAQHQQQKHTQTAQDKSAIEQNNLELEKAERERREKLGL